MRLGLGLGLFKAGAISAGVRIFSAFQTRVIADGGTIEAGSCVVNTINSSSILQRASLLLIPSGYKGGKLYAEIPTNGNGDLTWTRSGTANRTNSSGNIELMASGVPRLSYMYGSCPAALLESQRTNTLLYSNDFTTASWVKDNGGATNPVVTANYATSPDGSNNASRLQLNKTGGTFSRIYQYGTGGAGAYSFTVYMKSNTGSSQNVGLRLDLTGINCVVTTSWQRFTLNSTVGTAQAQIMLYDLISGNDETADILIYGAQLEAGAYPTTYIPTTSATATRVADSFSRNNIYTNGLISASGGTWFVELRGNVSYTRDSGSLGLNLDESSLGNGFAIRNGGSGRLIIQKYIAGGGTTLYTTLTDTVKIAIKWNGTSADVFVNGTKQVSATSFTQLNMGNLNLSSGQVPYFIQQMALFPSPLSDSDCQTLTTL